MYNFFMDLLSLEFLWIAVWSFLALIMMGIDKVGAKLRRSRIRERTFGVISLLGGFPGVFLGGILFHHKTSKPRFWIPVVVSLLLWGALLVITNSHLI
jgi:uncharacterized membrane protein YsdA (DUF1294 family)